MSIKILLAIKSSVLERFYHQHRTCLGLPEASRHETLRRYIEWKLKINSILSSITTEIIFFLYILIKINNYNSTIDRDKRISIEWYHQLFRVIVTQPAPDFFFNETNFVVCHRVYNTITLQNEVISVRNNARACSQNRGGKKESARAHDKCKKVGRSN